MIMHEQTSMAFSYNIDAYSFYQDISRFTTDDMNSLTVATNRLRLSKQWIDSAELNVEKLRAIAYARSALAVTAECINKVVSAPESISHQERLLLEDASKLCSGEDNWRK